MNPSADDVDLLLIAEAAKGLDDVAAGRVKDAREAIQALKHRRISEAAEAYLRPATPTPLRKTR